MFQKNQKSGEKKNEQCKNKICTEPDRPDACRKSAYCLYAYLIAKHDDGTFMLRIEDTDQERFQEGALDIIYRTLKETGLVQTRDRTKTAAAARTYRASVMQQVCT